jgi:hypothetical protein
VLGLEPTPGPRGGRPYRLRSQPWWPAGESDALLSVDAELDEAVLDRLNAIPGLLCIGTCAGHRPPHVPPYEAWFGVTLATIDGVTMRQRRGASGLTVRTFQQIIRRHRLPLVDLRTIPSLGMGNPPSWWATSPRLDDPAQRLRWFATTVERLASAVAHHATGQRDFFLDRPRRDRSTATCRRSAGEVPASRIRQWRRFRVTSSTSIFREGILRARCARSAGWTTCRARSIWRSSMQRRHDLMVAFAGARVGVRGQAAAFARLT